MSHWTDAHCHLQEQFLRGDDASLAVVTETLSRAYEGGVDRVVVIGTDLTTSRQALDITALEGPVEIYATVGLHPHDALQDIGPVRELAREQHPKLVGIGECGLDYYYEHSPRDDQRRAFAAQISLAHARFLVVSVDAESYQFFNRTQNIHKSIDLHSKPLAPRLCHRANGVVPVHCQCVAAQPSPGSTSFNLLDSTIKSVTVAQIIFPVDVPQGDEGNAVAMVSDLDESQPITATSTSPPTLTL